MTKQKLPPVEDKLMQAERELVFSLQEIIDAHELDDFEVLEILHRLVGVGISKIRGDCAK